MSRFSFSSAADPFLNYHLLFTPKPMPPIPCINKLSLYSALSEKEPSTHVSCLPFPSHNPDERPRIRGIVNGLVCLDIQDVFYIWNPALRKSKRLSSPNFLVKHNWRHFEYGFGYDSSNDDYKFFYWASTEDLGHTEYMVYSLMTDSWKRSENYKGPCPCRSFGMYAGGKIYWYAMYSSSDPERYFVSFDMASEKHEEHQFPSYEGSTRPCMGYGEFEGKFYVLYEYDLKKTELWVMEESWSKLFSIPYDDVGRPPPIGRVLCILRNGVIVSGDGYSPLLVHHIKGKDSRTIKLSCIECCTFYVYVESLVSPNGPGL